MSLPRDASRLPLLAVTFGLQAWERTRGPREFAIRRASELAQIASYTPLGRLFPPKTPDDGAQAEAERIAEDARGAVVATISAAAKERAQERASAKPAAATSAAASMGAPGAAAAAVAKVTAQLDVETPASRDDLPIPDFDNITLGSLRARLRSLSVEDLATLREWERAHAHRLPVLTLLDNRIAKIAATDSAAYPPDPQTSA